MIIRPATFLDIPALTKLGRELWDLHVDFDKNYYSLEESFDVQFTQWLNQQIGSSYQFILVGGGESGEIVGFIAGFIKSLFPWFKVKNVGHISYLIISSPHRRKKVGALLENEAIKWFQTKGINYIELYVDENNETGKSAWNRYGYLPFKRFLRKTV